MTLTKLRIHAGVYEGVLCCDPAIEAPEVIALHLDAEVAGVTLEASGTAGEWLLRFVIPTHLLSDGVQGFVLASDTTSEPLDAFAVATGAVLSDDLRAEITLLRAELDMMKRAFRRQFNETR